MPNQEAGKKIADVFDRLEEKMDHYQKQKVRWDNAAKHRPGDQPPTPLDFAALAKANDLTSGQTGLDSAAEIADEPLGSSLVNGACRSPTTRIRRWSR